MAGSVAGSVTGAVLGVVATGSVFAGRVVLGAVLSCAGAAAQPVSSKISTRRGAKRFIRDLLFYGAGIRPVYFMQRKKHPLT